MANAACDEALADAGIDTKTMTMDRDRFGIQVTSVYGAEEGSEESLKHRE